MNLQKRRSILKSGSGKSPVSSKLRQSRMSLVPPEIPTPKVNRIEESEIREVAAEREGRVRSGRRKQKMSKSKTIVLENQKNFLAINSIESFRKKSLLASPQEVLQTEEQESENFYEHFASIKKLMKRKKYKKAFKTQTKFMNCFKSTEKDKELKAQRLWVTLLNKLASYYFRHRFHSRQETIEFIQQKVCFHLRKWGEIMEEINEWRLGKVEGGRHKEILDLLLFRGKPSHRKSHSASNSTHERLKSLESKKKSTRKQMRSVSRDLASFSSFEISSKDSMSKQAAEDHEKEERNVNWFYEYDQFIYASLKTIHNFTTYYKMKEKHTVSAAYSCVGFQFANSVEVTGNFNINIEVVKAKMHYAMNLFSVQRFEEAMEIYVGNIEYIQIKMDSNFGIKWNELKRKDKLRFKKIIKYLLLNLVQISFICERFFQFDRIRESFRLADWLTKRFLPRLDEISKLISYFDSESESRLSSAIQAFNELENSILEFLQDNKIFQNSLEATLTSKTVSDKDYISKTLSTKVAKSDKNAFIIKTSAAPAIIAETGDSDKDSVDSARKKSSEVMRTTLSDSFNFLYFNSDNTSSESEEEFKISEFSPLFQDNYRIPPSKLKKRVKMNREFLAQYTTDFKPKVLTTSQYFMKPDKKLASNLLKHEDLIPSNQYHKKVIEQPVNLERKIEVPDLDTEIQRMVEDIVKKNFGRVLNRSE